MTKLESGLVFRGMRANTRITRDFLGALVVTLFSLSPMLGV